MARVAPRRLRSFPPIIDGASRVLVLGTMPGPESLRRRQYYAHPANRFWTLVAAALGRQTPRSYAEKRAMLREGRIALWDTLRFCRRLSALDSDIRAARLNDVSALLARYPNIRAIFANGRGAERFLRRHGKEALAVPVQPLPSSSPANAGMSPAQKRRRWRALRRWLERGSQRTGAKKRGRSR